EASREADAPAAPGLELTPSPQGTFGWAGISLWENLIQYGFSADSKMFVLCMNEPRSDRFAKGCDLLDTSGRLLRYVTSNENYGTGDPHEHDPAFAPWFKSLGVPAVRGKTPLASEYALTWTHEPHAEEDQPFKRVTFTLEHVRTHDKTVIANFSAKDP